MTDQTAKTAILTNLRRNFSSGKKISLKQKNILPAEPAEPIGLEAVEQALDEFAGVAAQALPQVPPASHVVGAGVTKKESLSATVPSSEILPGVQSVEQEVQPEISPEVESFVEHHESHADKLPDEIVIADGAEPKLQTHLPKTPVIVLPIDQKVEKDGQKKSPKFSVRWLVEWSRRLIKKFAGQVIYRA